MSRKKKAVAAVCGVGVVLATAGGAYGLWTSTATGSSSSKALTAQTVSVTAETATADLYPGFSGGDVFFGITTNNNPYPIRFTSMAPGAITSSNQTACPASHVTVASKSGLTIDVAAGAAATGQTIADVVTLATAAPDGCQGVTFTIALTLTGAQT